MQTTIGRVILSCVGTWIDTQGVCCRDRRGVMAAKGIDRALMLFSEFLKCGRFFLPSVTHFAILHPHSSLHSTKPTNQLRRPPCLLLWSLGARTAIDNIPFVLTGEYTESDRLEARLLSATPRIPPIYLRLQNKALLTGSITNCQRLLPSHFAT
jgi:hypothetical protein